jgi:hypothetical protein
MNGKLWKAFVIFIKRNINVTALIIFNLNIKLPTTSHGPFYLLIGSK